MNHSDLCVCCSRILYRSLDDLTEVRYGVLVRDTDGNEYNLCHECLDTLLFESAMIDNGRRSSLSVLLSQLPAR